MSINFRTVSFFVVMAALGLSACSKPDTDIEVPNFDKLLEGKVLTCSKSEAEVPVSEEAAKNVIVAEDNVTTQDVEISGCEGESLGKETKVIDGFNQEITIEKLAGLNEPVGSVTVENLRTCAMTRAEASIQSFTIEVPNADGTGVENVIKIPTNGPQATYTGDVRLPLITGTLILAKYGINIVEGQNVLQIKYFGKCRKYQEATEDQPKSCLDHDLIGQKTVLLQVKMNPVHKEEIGQEVRCKKEEPKSEGQPESKPDSKPVS